MEARPFFPNLPPFQSFGAFVYHGFPILRPIQHAQAILTDAVLDLCEPHIFLGWHVEE